MHYKERSVCIFCKGLSLETHFKENYSIPISSYNVEEQQSYIYIPFNILKCNRCLTYQTKYLGDLHIIYAINHADACGSIRSEMMKEFSSMISSNNNVKNILEIGAGNGILSDILVEENKYNYTIVDPSYFGNTHKKRIIKDFIENVNIDSYNIDTVVISHVFEHFYEPLNILEKIRNTNIQHFYLNFPDLESYVQDGTYHVLNPEHTFYVENKFLIDIIHNYGFKLVKRIDFKRHSVFLEFIRDNNLTKKEIKNINAEKDIHNFYNNIFKILDKTNNSLNIEVFNDKKVYVWPCSMHSMYLITLGLDINKIHGFVDNSSHKINKYLYGYNKLCYSFVEKDNDENILLINGGCFNKELELKENYRLL